MNWLSWVPLTALVALVVLGQALAVATDMGFRVRREMRALGPIGSVRPFGVMDLRGMAVRPVFLWTENRSVRGSQRRQAVWFWVFIAVVAGISIAADWPWWVPSGVISVAFALQIVDLRALGGAEIVPPGVSQRGRGARVVGIVASLTILVAGVFLLAWGVSPGMAEEEILWRAGLAICGVVLLYAALWLRRFAERFAAVVEGETRFGEDASADDVLFLRSFRDDKMRIRAPDPLSGQLGVLVGHRLRLEEHVANMLIIERRLIAAGRPGESLPSLGALRTYCPMDDWQHLVESAAERVGMILMIAAGTEGFQWELNLARQTGNLSKTLILIPPLGLDGSVVRMQDLFARLGLAELDGFGPDEWDEWGCAFVLGLTGVGFADDGEPIFYLGLSRDWASYAATVLNAMVYIQGRAEPLKKGEFARAIGLHQP